MSAESMKITDRRAMTVLGDEPQPETAVTASPVDALLSAIHRNPNMNVALLEKLMDLAERWRLAQAAERAAQAEREYVTAFAQFKQNMPDVVKDMLNKQYGSDYSSLANLVNKTNQHLGAYGLNARWDIEQEEGMAIICILTHVGGHKERVRIRGPIDTSGTKNALQGIKSTLTYLEGATFQAITGVVARSACADDDANGTGNEPEATAPAGYDKWRADMKALADEGTERLQEVWKESNGDFRRYAVDHDELWWGETKRKAAKAKQA